MVTHGRLYGKTAGVAIVIAANVQAVMIVCFFMLFINYSVFFRYLGLCPMIAQR